MNCVQPGNLTPVHQVEAQLQSFQETFVLAPQITQLGEFSQRVMHMNVRGEDAIYDKLFEPLVGYFR